MKIVAAAVLAGITMALTACAINPPPEVTTENRCNFRRLALDVPLPGESLDQSPGSLADDLRAVYRSPAHQEVSDSLLFLSGGSQEGAFGAGYLHGWSSRRTSDVAGRATRGLRPGPGLPKFRVVTAISTGAILSTWAFINQTEHLVRRYRITRESDVLRPYASATSEFSLARAVARRGAVGDLSPLRTQLRIDLTPAVMTEVARAGREERRRLYVGVVDVDTGGAVALDLTHMAQQYVDNPARRDFYRDCYAEAIVASSSVPLAAPPAFIDNRMYIDGGARFGVFSEQIATVIDPGPGLVPPGVPGNYYIIANRRLRVEPQCGKVDEADCRPPPNDLNGPLRPWRFLGLARRSTDILIDQTYRSSIERILREARAAERTPLLAFIHPEAEDHWADVTIPGDGSGRHMCKEWRAIDVERDHPLEFHPRYMHCLVSYGDWLAGNEGWHLLE